MARFLPFLTLFALTGWLAAQSTLLVPAQFPTIQAAINASANGDTVLVSPGSYAENLVINGKAIILESTGGPDLTAVNGSFSGTVLSISNVQDYAARVEGFTFRNGQGDSVVLGPGGVGGISLNLASLTIRDCVVENCLGGDTLPSGGFPNTFPGVGGAGGIGIVTSFPRIEDCIVRNNVGGEGQAEQVQSIPTLPPVPFVSRSGVGGVYAVQSVSVSQPAGFTLSISRCRIVGNIGGDGYGNFLFGPIEVGGTSGLEINTEAFRVEECLIARNIGGPLTGSFPATSSRGGCVRARASVEGTLDRVTVTGNIDCNHEVAVVLMDNVEMRNSIIRSNPGVVSEVEFVLGSPAVNYSNIGGGIAGVGNVDLPSGFVDAAGGDYSLATSSALRDLGDASGVLLPATDLGGGFRWVGDAPEMGCFEIDDLDGSAEDFQLRTVVNSGGNEDFPTKFVSAGDLVEVSFGTDGGTFVAAVPALFVQVFTTGFQPASPVAFPELEINDQGGTLVLFDGNVFGPAILGATPYAFNYAMPALSGITARFQAACFSGAAANGIFATTRAHDLIFP